MLVTDEVPIDYFHTETIKFTSLRTNLFPNVGVGILVMDISRCVLCTLNVREIELIILFQNISCDLCPFLHWCRLTILFGSSNI